MGAVPPYKRTLREFIAEASSDAAGALGGRARASRLADPAAAHAALCHPLLRERWGAAEHRVHPASGVHHIVCTGVPAALEEQRAALARAQAEGRPLQVRARERASERRARSRRAPLRASLPCGALARGWPHTTPRT